MNIGLNAGIKALEAVKDIVSEKTKGQWSSWFKVGESRQLIDKICSVALTDMLVDRAKGTVPEGFVLVPKEPTPAMLYALWEHRDQMTGQSENKIARKGYASMLAAASKSLNQFPDQRPGFTSSPEALGDTLDPVIEN